MANQSIYFWSFLTSPFKWLSELDWRTRNPIDGKIERIKREAALALDGTKIPGDKEPLDCLVINGIEGRYWGLKVCSKKEQNGVAFFAEEKDCYVTQTELIERFGIDPFDVMQHANWGTFSKLLEREKVSLVFANYLRLISKQESPQTPKLNPELLMKVISVSLRHMHPNDFGFLCSSNTSLRPLLKERNIIVGFREGKVHLLDISEKILIGVGGQASVYKVLGIGSKRCKAFKEFSGEYFNVWPEAIILQKIHQGYPANEKGKHRIPGIIPPFSSAVALGQSSGGTMHLFEGNLIYALGFRGPKEELPSEKDIFENIEDKLSAFNSILTGFKYCVEQEGLIYGDFKLANILFSNSEGIKLYLADFGSALLYPKDKPRWVDFQKPWSKEYLPWSDYQKKLDLGRNGQVGTSASLFNAYVDHCRSCDIFSLGSTLASFLVPTKRLFEYDEKKCPLPKTFNRKILEDNSVPKNICDLIQNMLHVDPKKRPTINEVEDLYGRHG